MFTTDTPTLAVVSRRSGHKFCPLGELSLSLLALSYYETKGPLYNAFSQLKITSHLLVEILKLNLKVLMKVES